MLSGKFLFTLVGIMVAIFAICKLDFNQNPLRENWGSVQLGRKALPGAVINGKTTAIGGNFFKPKMGGNDSVYGHSKFVQVPQFQGILSPRMNPGVDFGANIRYNVPDEKNMAFDYKNPLAFGDMASEGYKPQAKPKIENYSNSGGGCAAGGCKGCSAPSCGKGGVSKWSAPVAGGYELPSGPGVLSADPNSNYNQLWNKLRQESSHPDPVSDMPVGTMTTMDASGQLAQPVVFDRLMYAPSIKSRLSAQGDLIRGDLAVTPCQSGWFSVYPNINRDLQEGSLAIIGGAQAADQDLVNLINQSSGGMQTSIAGLNFADTNMIPDTTQTIASLSDVYTTAFP